MACKNKTEALLEDVIEITWVFDGLIKSNEIKSWDEILENFCGSDGIKHEIRKIAEDFEKKYPFDTTWEDTDLDYIEEIEKFAKEKLIEKFGKQNEITLRDFLHNKTHVRELCVIRGEGWIVGTCWIDCEDLFAIPHNLADKVVKGDKWGYLTIVDENNDCTKIPCHYVDV